MRLIRGILLVLAAVAAIVLAIRATYFNVNGRPELATSVALGIAIAVANLMTFVPRLRPPRPPTIVVDHPDAGPDEVYGHDNLGNYYSYGRDGRLYRYNEVQVERVPPPLPPPHWWNWPARLVLLLDWPTRAALAGYAGYFVAQELDRGFNLRLLQLAAAAQVLLHLRLVAQRLAGFRVDWSAYRGWRIVRKLINIAIRLALAGYAFVIADLIGAILAGIPRGIYRGLDSLWHLPWLNVPIVVLACIVLAIIISVIVGRIQRLIVRLLGPDSQLGSTLDDLRLITWEGDVREFFRRGDRY